MNTAQEKEIYVISNQFPYGKGEIFVEREIIYFNKVYKKVHLLPLSNKSEKRNVETDFQLDNFFSDMPNKAKASVFFKNFRLISGIIFLEFRKTKVKKYFLKKLRKLTGELTQTVYLADKFEMNFINSDKVLADFYSVWMDKGALLLAILKKKEKIKNFYFRLHGFDLYDDRREGNYMPFRYFCFQQATKIFMVSEAGKKYLTGKDLFPNKLIANYSGIYDNGMNPKVEKNDEFVLCSCSNLIPLKRVDRIISILNLLKFKVKWIHIGDGAERNKLQSLINCLPENITVELKGMLSFKEVQSIYSNTPIDLFIHLSRTEGLPLSLVEAMSAGIPVIATDAGGTNEIVNSTNGELIPLNFEDLDVSEIITYYYRNELSWKNKKEGARLTFLEKFDAKKNYPYFVDEIYNN